MADDPVHPVDSTVSVETDPAPSDPASVEPLGAEEAHSSDDGNESLTLAEKRLLGGLAVVGIVVLCIVLAANFLGGDDNNAVEPETAANAAEVFTKGGGIVEAPAELPTTTDPTVDDLSRAELDGGPLDWTVLGEGSWSPDDGVLRSTTEPEGANPMAVIAVPDDLGDDWAFSVSVETPAQNAGFVWGVEDEDNYWELRSNQQFAAVVINRIDDGETTQVKTIGPSGLAEGQRFTIAHQGDTVTLAEGGQPFLAISDESLAQPRQVGVVASAEEQAGFTMPELTKIDDG